MYHLPGYFMQFYAVFTASLGAMAVGITIGWISPTVIILKSDNSPIPVTNTELSLIINLQMIGAIIFSPIAGTLSSIAGRKPAILLSTILHVISWIMISQAETVWEMCIARFIQGSGSSCIMTGCIMYIGEVCEDSRRGSSIGLFNFMLNFGILWSLCVGPYVSLSTMALICLIIPLLLMVTFIWVPESPYFYQIKERDEETMMSLKKLRKHDMVQKEFEKIQMIVKKDLENRKGIFDLFKDPNNRKALIIVLILIAVKQLTGSEVFLTYNEPIFEQSGSSFSSSLSAIIVGIVYILSLLLAMALVDRIGRKPLMVFGSITGMLFLVLLGAYFFVKDMYNVNIDKFEWAPLTIMIILYIVQSGLTVVPTVYQSELFASDVKSAANSVVNIALNIYAFLGSEMYLLIDEYSNIYVIFWLFAIFCGLTMIFSLMFLPETKGKSFDEIQDWLRKK